MWATCSTDCTSTGMSRRDEHSLFSHPLFASFDLSFLSFSSPSSLPLQSSLTVIPLLSVSSFMSRLSFPLPPTSQPVPSSPQQRHYCHSLNWPSTDPPPMRLHFVYFYDMIEINFLCKIRWQTNKWQRRCSQSSSDWNVFQSYFQSLFSNNRGKLCLKDL